MQQQTKVNFYLSVPKILETETRFLDYLEAKLMVCRDRKEIALYNRAIRNQKKKIKALKMLIRFT